MAFTAVQFSSSSSDPSVRVICHIEATRASASVESGNVASDIRVSCETHRSSNPCSDSAQSSVGNSCIFLEPDCSFDHFVAQPQHCMPNEDECKQDGEAPKPVARWRPRCMMERTWSTEAASTSRDPDEDEYKRDGEAPKPVARWRPRCMMERTSSAETVSTATDLGTSTSASLARTSTIETTLSSTSVKKVDLYIDEEGRHEIIEIERFDHPIFVDYFKLPDDCRRGSLRVCLQDARGRLQQRSLVTRDATSLACLKALQSESVSAADLQHALRFLQQRSPAVYDARNQAFLKAAQSGSTSGRCQHSVDFSKGRHGCKLAQSRFKDFKHDQRHLVRSR